MIENLKSFLQLLSRQTAGSDYQAALETARRKSAVPTLWLLGKAQSGKTSIIKYLTGSSAAVIGNGFKPCTPYSRLYDFPNSEAPVITFLDTRGLGERDYDPAEDIAQGAAKAHLVIITSKLLDHAQDSFLEHLHTIRATRPSLPMLLAVTCLHEAYPQRQHPPVYPFLTTLYPEGESEKLLRSLAEHQRIFRPLVTDMVPIDLTPPEEGFIQPDYGGSELKQAILRCLPESFRQTLITLDIETGELKNALMAQAIPIIIGYSTLAATVSAYARTNAITSACIWLRAFDKSST